MQTVQTFRIMTNRTFNKDFLYCNATNILRVIVLSTSIQLDIKYPPNSSPVIENGFNNGSDYRVIEERSYDLICSIDESNPPAELTWACDEPVLNISSNISAKVIQFVPRSRTNTHCTCESKHALGSRNVVINMIHLYKPTTPDMYINGTALTSTEFIENTTVFVNCSSDGNPKPNILWSANNTIISFSQVLKLQQINRARDGELITCSSENIMKDSKGLIETATVKKNIKLEVLYPPEVNLTYYINVIEGDDVHISCVQTPGKVTHQSIHWTSQHTNVSYDNNLVIRNVTRKHAGNCSCMIDYTMIPTYGESKSDSIIGVVYLDVFYKAELANFFVGQNNQNQRVTVNEKDSVPMMCILDSNPNSTMQIAVRNSIVASQKHTKTLEHHISQTRCNDAGIYTCYGFNFLNAIHSSRELRLFVNCSPRQSSSTEVQQTLTISQDGTATFSFTTLAYPPPNFKWLFRPANSELIEAINGQNNTRMISDNEMQINFTVTNVDISDYGEYVLTINNTFGSYQQSFFLLQNDVTYDKQNSPPGGGNAGQVAGGLIGGILGVGTIVAAVILVRRRLHGKQLDAANTSCDLSLSKFSQHELKDGDCTITADGDISNVYEKVQHAGSDRQYLQLTSIALKENKDGECTETADGGISNIYEKLHNAGERIVYENLRIQRNTV